MRPVRRNVCPHSYDDNYTKYKPHLDRTLGLYCSYCEERIPVSLHIEHIQSRNQHSELETEWTNLLFACGKCNGTKKDKVVVLQEVYLPDRDNTFLFLAYLENGQVEITTIANQTTAQNTINLVGLNTNGSTRLFERRQEVWLLARLLKSQLERTQQLNPNLLTSVIPLITLQAEQSGFFSIWMKVFENYPEVRNALIDAFPSTRESGCFDANGEPVSCPNLDNLPHGGKI